MPENPKVDPDIMRWQYWESPFGAAHRWVIEDAGRIVAHVARLPVPVLVGGRRAQGAIGVDVVTDPAYRDRGLYSSLRDTANADCCRRGLIVSFNARATDSMLPRRSYAPSVAPLVRFVLPASAEWLRHRLRLPGAAARAVVRRALRRSSRDVSTCDEAPGDVDSVWREVAGRCPFAIEKALPWWRWRYDGHPKHPYRIVAFRRGGRLRSVASILLRPVGEAVYADVLELLATQPEHATAVLHFIGATFEVAAVALRARPGTPQSEMARVAGMLRVPRRLEGGRVTLNVRDLCGDRPDLLAMPWSLSWGDLDHL